jgi:hypothetical protein
MGMTIGIEQFRTRRGLWLYRMLARSLRGLSSGEALYGGKEKRK